MTFVDTNILVYATFQTSPQHAAANAALTQLMTSSRVGVSRQILRELLSAVTRPQSWASPMPLLQAETAAGEYRRAFEVIEDSPTVWGELERLSRLALFGGKQVHDAGIVATMLAHGVARLLTFNGVQFRRFARIIEVVEP